MERQSRNLVSDRRCNPRNHRTWRTAHLNEQGLLRFQADFKVAAGQREKPSGRVLLGGAQDRLGIWRLHPGDPSYRRHVGLPSWEEGPATREIAASRLRCPRLARVGDSGAYQTGTIRMAVNGVEVTRYTDEDA